MSDIVDAIDALVDEQLEGGPVDDYNADRYDRCPHCRRHWHGLRITERIAHMYNWGRFDETYRADEDDSRVLCEGSDFIGPMPSEVRPRPGLRYEAVRTPGDVGQAAPEWLQDMIRRTQDFAREALAGLHIPYFELVTDGHVHVGPSWRQLLGGGGHAIESQLEPASHDDPDGGRPLRTGQDFSVGPRYGAGFVMPQEGDRVSFAMNGRIVTGIVSNVEQHGNTYTIATRSDDGGPLEA